MKRVSVIADSLVEKTPITERLNSRGAEIAFERLTAGDYRVSSRCTIVVLPIEEFARLTSDRKLFRRVADFKKSVSDPIIIVQGDQQTNGNGPSRAAVRGALAFLAVHNRVPVLFVEDDDAAADLIYAMGNQVQNGMGESLSENSRTTPDTDRDKVELVPGGNGNGNGNGNGQGAPANLVALPEQIVRLLPDISPTIAKSLLERFGSLRAVFTANSRELSSVRGVGPKRAKQLASFFDRSYKKRSKARS